MGHLDIVEWMDKNYSVCGSANAFNWSVERKDPEMARWLHAHGYKGDVEEVIYNAARLGKMDMIKWLLELNYTISIECVYNAA